jgi:T-complex protein 1 subunit zeta
MSSVQTINPNAEVMRSGAALLVNVNAAKGLQDVLRTNLGPKGTLKMLVGGAGQIKITKDGNVLLHEMQIQHPTAIMIARTATAQDDETGDGTSSIVLFTGELLKYAERVLSEGVHPRIIADGFEMARNRASDFLRKFMEPKISIAEDRELLCNIARTSLRTKLQADMADQLTEIVTDAVLSIARPGEPLDLHMVERMHIMNRTDRDSRLVKGLVMDHGSRHPDMPKYLENCYILTCNVSLEYEKTEVSSSFLYSTAEEREKLVEAERRFTDARVRDIIALKKAVCTPENGKTFVVINQKGIDPVSLDMLAKEGIIALRRAKRRNMKRLTLACGGLAVNSTEDMTPDVLGTAGKVYEQVVGDDKYTFVEDVAHPFSCTILLKGPNPHTIAQLKDAVRDGLRAIKNALEDEAVVAGAGAFEIAAAADLREYAKTEVTGKSKLGIMAYADALEIIPKTLAANSGFDVSDTLIKLQEEAAKAAGAPVGLDVETGEACSPGDAGIWDNLRVKQQFLSLATILASQLLVVDEVMRAGRGSRQ